MTRRAAAALIVAVLGFPFLGMPAHADDHHARDAPKARVEERRAPEQRARPEQRPAIQQRQPHRDLRSSIGQRDQRERFEHRPIIPQRERVDNRPAVQQPPRADNRPRFQPRHDIDNRPATRPPSRVEKRPPFQSRGRVDNRPAVPLAPRFNPPTNVQPRDRRTIARHYLETRSGIGAAPGSAIDLHDRQWHERRFADRDPHRWRGGHWRHGYRGGHMGWWWVIGPAWYLYSAPIYPYPDPDAQILIIDSPDIMIPATDVCREFNGDAIVNDTGEPFYGTACLQPDGLWHIVIG